MLSSLAMRLRAKMQSDRRGAFAVWNECLDHVALLADSHMDRVLLESFQTGTSPFMCLLRLIAASAYV